MSRCSTEPHLTERQDDARTEVEAYTRQKKALGAPPTRPGAGGSGTLGADEIKRLYATKRGDGLNGALSSSR
jgi:hypothetical protein